MELAPSDIRFRSITMGVSAIFWSFPGILLTAPTICKQSIHFSHWYNRFWHILLGSSDRHTTHEALFQVQTTYDIRRLYVLICVTLHLFAKNTNTEDRAIMYSFTGCWILCEKP